MSSTKSSIGHLLGAAGAVEAIFSIMAIATGIVPPTLNLDNPSEGCDIDLVPHDAKERPMRRRAVQLVRLRRHQRLADLQEGELTAQRPGRRMHRNVADSSAPSCIAVAVLAAVGCLLVCDQLYVAPARCAPPRR